ncbi:hypothetical protein H0E87_019867 [Populus deltoides]|uniref:Uncharacterized protein n=1 Tax=Populus deltoides TaxID=3696 RepID=A0A8T2XWY9_POPDE|nr:hypothetical protein H0E87_019867 [Populus deltoides]
MERGRFVTEEDSKGSPLGLEKRVESTNKSRKTLQDKQLTTARVREMRGHVVAADHMFWQRGSWFRVVLGDWAPLNGTLNLNSQAIFKADKGRHEGRTRGIFRLLEA